MADVIKKVDRGIPSNHRTQTFTQADASVGDLILVKDSLGKQAKTLIIDATAAITIRLNVRRTIFPLAGPRDGLQDGHFFAERRNLTKGEVIEDETGGVIVLGAGDTFTLNADVAISDIKIVSAAGDFEIFVT